VPSGGGGGLAIIDDKHVQLTTPQYELLEMLLDRMRKDANKPHHERGFVAVSELLRLSLDVAEPTEQHVRQLVYRVRRVLVNAGVGDLIEVRRGVGYRLRAVTRNWSRAASASRRARCRCSSRCAPARRRDRRASASSRPWSSAWRRACRLRERRRCR